MVKNRYLSVEFLEERALLAIWGGFEPTPVVSTYQAGGTAVTIDLVKDVDLVQVADVNKNGVDDLITINYASSSVTVYFGDGLGNFTAGTEIFLRQGGSSNNAIMSNSGVTIADVTGNGQYDILVASPNADNPTLTIRVFQGGTNGTFATTSIDSTVSLTPLFTTGENFFLPPTTVRVTMFGTNALAVQVQGMFARDQANNAVPVGGTLSFTKGVGGTFSDTGVVKVTGLENLRDLADSISTSGLNLLVYHEGSMLYFRSTAGVTRLIKLSDISSGLANLTTIIWVSTTKINSENYLILGGQGSAANTRRLVILKPTISGNLNNFTVSIGADAYKSYQSDIPTTTGGLGYLNKDATTPYIDFVAFGSGGSYTVLLGKETTGAVPEFTENQSVITQPDFFSTAVTDLNRDGTMDILAVAATGIWAIYGNDLTASPILLFSFSTSVTHAVIGNFDNDALGRLDVVGVSGNSAYFFKQTGNSTFLQDRQLKFPTKGGLNPSLSLVTTGYFTTSNYAQVAILCSWLGTANTPALAVYDFTTTTDVHLFSVNLPDSAPVLALAAGKYSGGTNDDLIYSTTTSKIRVLKNLSWSAGEYTPVGSQYIELSVLPTGQTDTLLYQPTSLAVADIGGDSRVDIVYLNSSSGAKTDFIGWFLNGATTATRGEVIDTASGRAYGLALADITGDGKLDAVTVVMENGKAKVFVAKGNGAGFDLPIYRSLGGNYLGGIDFLGGSRPAPSITITTAFGPTGSPYGNLVLAAGKRVALLVSRESVANPGGFRYVTAATNISRIETPLANPTSHAGVYEWIDEWSTFYVEIWGSLDADGSIKSFQTSFTYNTQYYQFAGLDFNSAKFSVSVDWSEGAATLAADNGVITISGVAVGSGVSVAAGQYALLARVKLAPRGGVGVPIPNDGLFAMVDCRINAASPTSHSLNGSDSSTVIFNKPKLYPVRYDFNDDGAISLADFSAFTRMYQAPLTVGNALYKIFDVNDDNVLTLFDFGRFTAGYMLGVNTPNMGRFYDKISQDPTSWTATPLVSPMSPAGAMMSAGLNVGENLSEGVPPVESFSTDSFSSGAFSSMEYEVAPVVFGSTASEAAFAAGVASSEPLADSLAAYVAEQFSLLAGGASDDIFLPEIDRVVAGVVKAEQGGIPIFFMPESESESEAAWTSFFPESQYSGDVTSWQFELAELLEV